MQPRQGSRRFEGALPTGMHGGNGRRDCNRTVRGWLQLCLVLQHNGLGTNHCACAAPGPDLVHPNKKVVERGLDLINCEEITLSELGVFRASPSALHRPPARTEAHDKLGERIYSFGP